MKGRVPEPKPIIRELPSTPSELAGIYQIIRTWITEYSYQDLVIRTDGHAVGVAIYNQTMFELKFDIQPHTRHRSGGRITAWGLLMTGQMIYLLERHTRLIGYWTGSPAELVAWCARTNDFVATRPGGQ